MEVVDADAIDDRLVTEFVGLAVMNAGFDSAAGHPSGEGMRIVIAARAPFLDDRQPAEFAVAKHEGRVEKAARLQIGQKRGDRLIGFKRKAAVVLGNVLVAVPTPLVFHAAAVYLHESNASLDQAASDQALLGEMGALRVVESEEFFRRLGFTIDVDRLRRGHLHSIGEFERLDTRRQRRFIRSLAEMATIASREEVEFGACRSSVKLAGGIKLSIGEP